MVLVLVAILIFPLAFSFVVSLQDFELTKIGQQRFIGLENYVNLISNESFWTAMRNTIVFVVVAVGIEVVLGFGLALLLHNKATFLRGFFRSTLLTPMFITPIAVGLIFRFLTNSQLGVITIGLKSLGIYIDLFSPKLALLSIALIDVWQWTPFVFLILLSGMYAIPRNLFEASELDGASTTRTLLFITLPLLKRVLMIVLLLRAIDLFRAFETIVATTQGGPGAATYTLPVMIWETAFVNFQMGDAAAASIVLLVIVSIAITLLIRMVARNSRSAEARA